jgi:hypothetical protein
LYEESLLVRMRRGYSLIWKPQRIARQVGIGFEA